MMLYICSKYYKSILDDIKVIESNKIFIKNISKVQNFTKIVSGVTILVLCTLFDTSLFCTQFHENIFDGFQVVEWTQFSLENFQRGIIP